MNLLQSSSAASFFSGILHLKPAPDGWLPQRLTPAQFAYYAARQEGQQIRAKCAAGVQIRLRTDSPSLELEFDSLGGARKYLGLDVEVDGRVVRSVREPRFEGTFRQQLVDFSDLPRRSRDIIVYLPCCTIVRLKRVEVADGSLCEPLSRPPRRLLCLGDSITQGMDAVSPFSNYAAQLARLLDADLLNQGIGGHVFDADSIDAIPAFAPDVITIAYGTNDWKKVDAQELSRRATAYLEKVRLLFPAARISVVSPLWRGIGQDLGAGGLNLDDFGALIRRTAAAVPGLRVIDGFRLVPNQPMYFADSSSTHPNELGFLHYALNLYLAIRDAD